MWQAGMVVEQQTKSSCLKPSARSRECELKMARGFWNLKSNPHWTYFLQQGHSPYDSPNSIIKWRLSIQMSQAMGNLLIQTTIFYPWPQRPMVISQCKMYSAQLQKIPIVFSVSTLFKSSKSRISSEAQDNLLIAASPPPRKIRKQTTYFQSLMAQTIPYPHKSKAQGHSEEILAKA